jgi:hypothetical protein
MVSSRAPNLNLYTVESIKNRSVLTMAQLNGGPSDDRTAAINLEEGIDTSVYLYLLVH